MEGARIVRGEQVARPAGPLRLAAGLAILALLALLAVLLTPPYYHDWQFQRYLHSLVRDPSVAHKPADYLQAIVVDKAASMGLPVHITDVQVSASPTPKIEVLYVVHVELPVYTVDLHFRPTA